MADYLFAKPNHAPGFVTVAVNPSSDPLNPLARGGLHAICPEETRHAMVLAIKRDIDRNLPVDGWLRVVLSTPVQFLAVDEASATWVAMGLREKTGALFEVVYLSNVQRIFQIFALKSRQEKLTGKRFTVVEVVTLYNSKVSVSSGEAVNQSFMNSATNVWEGLLKHPLLRKMVIAAALQIVVKLRVALCCLHQRCALSVNVAGRQRSTLARKRRSTACTSWSLLCARRTGTSVA